VVLDDVVEQVEAILAASEGNGDAVALEDILLECEEHRQEQPILPLIVYGLEIIHVGHQQDELRDDVDDVQVVFHLPQHLVELIRNQFPHLLRATNLVVLKLF
jgi:hypothetical protein